MFARFVEWVLGLIADELPSLKLSRACPTCGFVPPPAPLPPLPPHSPELVARAMAELEQDRLQHRLNQLDAILGCALGSARLAFDPITGRPFAGVGHDRKWLS